MKVFSYLLKINYLVYHILLRAIDFEHVGLFYLFSTFYNFGGVFGAQLNACSGFCENSQRLKAVDCFCKWLRF